MVVLAIIVGLMISILLVIIGAHLVLDNYDIRTGMLIAFIGVLLLVGTLGLGVTYYNDIKEQPPYSKRKVFEKSEELYKCYPRAFNTDVCTLVAVKYNKILKATEEYEVVENPKWETVENDK